MEKLVTVKRDELARRARDRAREKAIPLSTALGEVGREDPRLALEAREEILGRKVRVVSVGEAPNLWAISVVDTDVGERLAEMARTRASEKGISYRAALSEVAREVPELVLAARAETMGIKL
jgi:hypothetical protein